MSESTPSKLSEMSQKTEFKVTELNRDNYPVWRWQTYNVARAKGLEGALKGEKVSEQMDQQALAFIGSTLDKENQMLVIGCNKTHEVMKRLEIIYENKTSFEKQELLSRLHGFSIASISEIAKSLSEI